eukprot:1116320-Pyramimonas_sp.AAC.1
MRSGPDRAARISREGGGGGHCLVGRAPVKRMRAVVRSRCLLPAAPVLPPRPRRPPVAEERR